MKTSRVPLLGAAIIVTLVASLVLARDYRTGTRVIVDTKKEKGAWLGVYTQPVDKSVMRELGLTSSDGEVVTGIVDDSPADKAGFEEDDVITSVNSDKIAEEGDLSEAIDKHAPGDKVSITLVRKGKQKQILVALGDREDYEDGPVVITGSVHEKPNYYFKHGDSYGYIGVSLDELNRQLGAYFGVERGRGVLISEVEKGSPAETAGLKAGDVIVAVDSEKVADIDEVQEIIRDKKEGDKVSISVLRDRKPININVVVEEQSGWDGGSTWGSVMTVPPVPAVPRIPKMKGSWHSRDTEEFYPDQSELQADLAKLRTDLSSMRDELTEELAGNYQKLSKRDIQELKRELERLNREIERLH